LKTIDEYNQEKMKTIQIENKQWQKCNIICSLCGEELLVDTWMIYTSNPPKRKVLCEKCGDINYILA